MNSGYGGGWTALRTGSNCTRSFAIAALLFAGTCTAGSAGQSTDPNGLRTRESRHASDWDAKGSVPAEPAGLPASMPADDLQLITEVLKPSTTELAALLGVSRQTVYNWRAGEPISLENDAKLKDFAAAAEILEAAGLAGQRRILRRKLAGGNTLFEAAKQGGNAKEAAEQLVAMLAKERQQREKLEKRLSDRKRTRSSVADVGFPLLNEQA